MAKNSEVTAANDSKYNDWAVQDALRTLTAAEEIKNDKKMMQLVEKKAQEEKEMLDKITAAKVLFGDEDDKSKTADKTKS